MPEVEPHGPQRRERMALLARASLDELTAAWGSLSERPSLRALRGPEIGLVMLRGRIGGGGAPFNLGEATVTRASVALDDGSGGPAGHAVVLGRAPEKARLAAAFDALAEAGREQAAIAALIAAARDRLAAEREVERRRTAATKVDFFTLVRGED